MRWQARPMVTKRPKTSCQTNVLEMSNKCEHEPGISAWRMNGVYVSIEIFFIKCLLALTQSLKHVNAINTTQPSHRVRVEWWWERGTVAAVRCALCVRFSLISFYARFEIHLYAFHGIRENKYKQTKKQTNRQTDGRTDSLTIHLIPNNIVCQQHFQLAFEQPHSHSFCLNFFFPVLCCCYSFARFFFRPEFLLFAIEKTMEYNAIEQSS